MKSSMMALVLEQPTTTFINPGITTLSSRWTEINLSNLNPDNWRRKPSAWHWLANAGACLMTLASLLVLFSSPISALAVRKLSTAAFQHSKWRPLLTQLQTREDALKYFMRAGSFIGLLVQVYDFETAKNTQQPSKLFSKIISLLCAALNILFPVSLLSRGLTFTSGGLWMLGEHNDIRNSLNLSSRREWDTRRLTRFFARQNLQTFIDGAWQAKKKTMKAFWQEVKSFCHYINQDLHDVLSLKPWQALLSMDKHQWMSTKPQAWQTALSSQLSFGTALGAVTALSLKRLRFPGNLKLAESLQTGIQWSAFFALGLQTLPLWMRAWQTRDQNDSKALLAGIPVMVFGRTMTLSKNFLFLSGFNGFGGALFSSGVASNSRKYRGLIEYLESIQKLAERHPELTAGDVLTYLQQGERQERLNHLLGKTRVAFLFDVLQQAQREQRSGVSLAMYLQPIVQGKVNDLT